MTMLGMAFVLQVQANTDSQSASGTLHRKMSKATLEIGSVDINASKTNSAVFKRAKASAPKTTKSKRWKKLNSSKAVFVFSKSQDYKKEGDPKLGLSHFEETQRSEALTKFLSFGTSSTC